MALTLPKEITCSQILVLNFLPEDASFFIFFCIIKRVLKFDVFFNAKTFPSSEM